MSSYSFFQWVLSPNRAITIIESQRLVVLGSTALFTMVGQLRNASMMMGNLEPTAWTSNSGEEKDSLDHSATDHYTV